MNNLSFGKQIPKNLAVNMLSFITTVLLGLWLTPYLLKKIGIIAYGFIPLAMFLSQYISVILNSINMSINRFLLVSLQKKNHIESNQIFNTSLVIVVVFILVQAMIMGVILFDINSFFEIPSDFLEDVIWLFGLTFVGFSISLVRSVFGTPIYSYNRLDILRGIDIAQNVSRIIVIIFLFSYDKPSLMYVGLANLIAALGALIPTLYYFRVFTPQIKIKILYFNKKYVLELSKMSTWILINQVGVLLLGNINLFMVNNFLGAKATGEFAIIIQINSLFRTLLTLFAGVITPVAMTYFAKKEFDKLPKFIILSIKMMSIGLIFPLAVLVGLSEYLIEFWIGGKYSYLHRLVSFSLLFFVFVIPVAPLFSINVAFNKVKAPALMAVFLGVFNIISIYVLITQTSLHLWGVVIVKILFEMIFAAYIVFYTSKLLCINKIKLLKVLFNTIVIFAFILFIIVTGTYIFDLNSLLKLLIYVVILFLIIFPCTIMFFFTKEEKVLLSRKYKILERFFL